MRFVSAVVLAGVALGLWTAMPRAAAQEDPSEYFPLARGFSWKYDYILLAGDKQTVVHQVEDWVRDGAWDIYTVAVLTGQRGAPLVLGEKIRYAVRPGEIVRIDRANAGTVHAWDPWFPFLSGVPAADRAWGWRGIERWAYPDRAGQDVPSEVSFEVEGEERVLVPAGEFSAWKVAETQRASGVSVVRWYAKGVGVVQETETNADSRTYTMKLVEFKK